MDMERILQEIYKQLPPQPAVCFTVEPGDDERFGNKLGGTPYFPKDMEYPVGTEGDFQGKPLNLLVQLNFEQLPHLPDFPTKGILQIFIAGDDLYGMCLDPDIGECMTQQRNFRVIYHERVLTDEKLLYAADEIPRSDEVDCLLPFVGCYKLVPQELKLINPTMHDYRFEKAYQKLCEDTGHSDGGSADLCGPIPSLDELDEEDFDKLYETKFPNAILGGYPFFTQEDPRSCPELAELDTLLFELDSVMDKEKGIDICWGDCGTGSFFLSREKLKALDFSRVLYNYDCY
ncbi:MAG: DUF1963 domain-containing protein [Oscillospiraceae bacterium]|nr:DUF1963 domain-containing protein [Oscillospiraceae bacterium]